MAVKSFKQHSQKHSNNLNLLKSFMHNLFTQILFLLTKY